MASVKQLRLSIDEKLMLWATLSNDHEDQYNLAFSIYRNLFDLVPEAQQLFPSNMHPTAPEVKKSLTFQRMALYLIRTLWSAAANVDRLEEQTETLHEIGKTHAKFACRGLKSEHWPAMGSAMLSAMKQHVEKCTTLPNAKQKKTAVQIWDRIIMWVIEETRNSFVDAISNGQSKPEEIEQNKTKRKLSDKNLLHRFVNRDA